MAIFLPISVLEQTSSRIRTDIAGMKNSPCAGK